jgi:hypothetical protein
MIRDCSRLRSKVADAKGRDSNNTTQEKSFPGGALSIIGSNSPSALASTPVRYILGDERDRWALSAGTEGDPWKLAETRTTTYYNRKLVDVSTCTIKGASPIAEAYEKGTQERWKHQCPHCGEWHEIDFDDINFIQLDTKATAAASITDAIIPFANGGIVHAAGGFSVPGNSFSGDLVPAMLNSGELVLNRAQQGVLADALGDGSTPNIKIDWVLKGDALYAVMNNNGRRTGRGEVVQRNRI